MCYFLRRAKSNQKHDEGCGPLDSRVAVQNSEQRKFLLNHKLCAYQKIFEKNRCLVPYSSEYFEPVRDGDFTAQGFIGIDKKTCSDLGRQ